jgi:hypothetical protein
LTVHRADVAEPAAAIVRDARPDALLLAAQPSVKVSMRVKDASMSVKQPG